MLHADPCGEAGEARGILNGSNFVATSLQLRSNSVATWSDIACEEVKTPTSSATLTPNVNVLKKYNCTMRF